MLRDITIGQHFPGNSLVHRFDPRLKLVLTIAYIVLLFAASNPLGLALSILFLAAMYKVAKIPGKMILKSLKPILPIVIFTAVLNLFFVSGEGEPLVHIWFLTIYAEGVRYAVLMAVRVMALIAGTSLLTYTTSPIVLTDAIEQLLKPLGKLHFPVHELAMMMSIALRFIPTLIEETDKIMNAQKARGAQLDTGKMTDRVKALVPVLIPLFISAFRRADELAMAMECRCYRGGDGRTRLKVLRCEKQDYITNFMNFLLTLAYDGTNYCGFQVQPNGRSVAQTFQDALQAVLGSRPDIKGCSRTDAGVHALGFKLNFHADTRIPAAKLPLALNQHLPPDIRVLDAQVVPEDFHARYAAHTKTYLYRIHNHPIDSPFDAAYYTRVPRHLDEARMQAAAQQFVGRHDFLALCAAGSSAAAHGDTVRTITDCHVTRKGDEIDIEVTADGYLYNMVRILAGTLCEAGAGRLDPAEIPAILESRDRSRAGPTLPAKGLFLKCVEYDL